MATRGRRAGAASASGSEGPALQRQTRGSRHLDTPGGRTCREGAGEFADSVVHAVYDTREAARDHVAYVNDSILDAGDRLM